MSLPAQLRVDGPAPLRGRLPVPGDKGISHRALLFAALAEGRSSITGLAGGDDVARTRRALVQLGVSIERDDAGAVVVEGRGATALREPDDVVDCANSGSSMRMLAGLLAGPPFLSVLTGDASLRRRPMRRVVEPLRAMGARVEGRAGGELAPLVVRGGDLTGCEHHLAVASAQVKTALVLAGLQARGVTEVVEPAPSRDHTERMLVAMGAPLERTGDRALRVTAGAPRAFELTVPGDPSSAAFWVVAAVITPGSDVVLEGVAINPRRIAFLDVLRRMGADIEVVATDEQAGEPVGDIRVVSSGLAATTIGGGEIALVIDEIPVLAVAAAFAEGITEIRDAAELRVKESDRIGAVEELLTRLGVGVETTSDGLLVRGGRPRGAMLRSHGDHRIAMAGAVALNAVDGGDVVRGWRAVGSSYPEFADHLARLTGRVPTP
jgi:3-phosphoshikimate 1-carboxyvinyltransferase